MIIDNFIKTSFEIAKEKGFYSEETIIENHITGLISELYETYQAHRNNLFTDQREYDSNWFIDVNSKCDLWIILYSKKIKNTFEDEITDLFIRVFNLSSFLNLNIAEIIISNNGLKDLDFDNQILYFNNLFLKYNDITLNVWINKILSSLLELCEIYNIPIIDHIKAKIKYNENRKHLHGKNY